MTSPSRRESLYEMTAEILALHQQRELAEEEGDSVEVARIDTALAAYLREALPAKVDGIRAYIASQENAAEVHAAEAKYHLAKAAQAKGNIERVKAMCLEVMRHFQQTAYRGILHTIRRVGNGGVRPLVIRQPALVPSSMRIKSVSLTDDEWQEVGRWLGKYEGGLRMWHVIIAQLGGLGEPERFLIRRDLERGTPVPGCELAERGEHLRVD